MKKAVITAQRQGGVIDAPDPIAKDNWAVIKIHSAPMCTEYKGFISGRPSSSLGHEAAGEIVEVAQPGCKAPGCLDTLVGVFRRPSGWPLSDCL